MPPRRITYYAQRNAAFLARYGISIPDAERYARRLGLASRSAARAAHALTSTERGLAIAFGLGRRAVAAQMPQAVRREHGQIVPRPHDRAPVPVRIIAKDVGDLLVLTRGDRVRRLASEHRYAVNVYLRTGDEAGLAKFRGKRIGGVELETRARFLDMLFDTGRLSGGPYPEVTPR
jgi:hypothetical protein